LAPAALASSADISPMIPQPVTTTSCPGLIWHLLCRALTTTDRGSTKAPCSGVNPSIKGTTLSDSNTTCCPKPPFLWKPMICLAGQRFHLDTLQAGQSSSRQPNMAKGVKISPTFKSPWSPGPSSSISALNSWPMTLGLCTQSKLALPNEALLSEPQMPVYNVFARISP